MKSPIRRFRLSIFYNQFYLEPEHPDPDAEYWDEKEESGQGFSAYPKQAAIGTPSETGICEVETELASEMPDVESSIQAVCFPIAVDDPGRLFWRTVFGGKEEAEYFFDIPPGNYDVFVRFSPLEGEEANEVGLRGWHVIISFLPQGVAKAGTFKLEYGEVPADFILHTSVE